MPKSKVFVVTDLGFGDAGKGSITNYLAEVHQAKSVIRYNGGPQAAHNVERFVGLHHTFAQFGSGTLGSRAETFLAAGMLVELENLKVEERFLNFLSDNVWERLVVDPEACLVTPAHKMICQLKEIKRGKHRIGSCGMGVGEAAKDRAKGQAITIADCLDEKILREKLQQQFQARLAEVENMLAKKRLARVFDRYLYFKLRLNASELAAKYHQIASSLRLQLTQEYLRNLVATNQTFIFEGAQGVLLDKDYGFYPYITKTQTTDELAKKMLQQTGADELKLERIGVIRAYGHRHGPGPFITENKSFKKRRDRYNRKNKWQGEFRVGWLDLVALRYGLDINQGVDYLAVTCLDQLSGLNKVKVCTSYDYTGDLTRLDNYFVWEPLAANKARIHALKKASPELIQTGELAEILMACRPSTWQEFPGWKRDISEVEKLDHLPLKARNYLDFLASESGLNVPIKIISVNATEGGKIQID